MLTLENCSRGALRNALYRTFSSILIQVLTKRTNFKIKRQLQQWEECKVVKASQSQLID